MKVYKIEMFAYPLNGDFKSKEQLKQMLENDELPNFYYYRNIQENDMGEWGDDHPVNKRDTRDKALDELFPIPNGLSLDDTPLKREYERVKSIMLKLIKENGELKASNTKLSKDNKKFAKVAELINTIKHN